MQQTKLELREYQIAAMREIYARWKEGHKRVMFQLPTGGGKTFLFSAIAKDLLQERILVLVHREELIYQAQESLESACGVRVGIIKSGVAPEPLCMIQVASVQTLVRRSLPPAGLVIVDECFPAGTLVDGKPIESYQVGDYVTSFEENTGAIAKKRVTRLFKNPLKELVKVILSNGDEIICTPSHPIFTPDGWKPAMELNRFDMMLLTNKEKSNADQNSNVQTLSKGICSTDLYRQEWQTAQRTQKNLQYGMQSGDRIINSSQHKSQVCFGTDDDKQSYAKGRISKQDESFTERNRTQAAISRGQWQGVDSSTVETASSFGGWMDCGTHCQDERGKYSWIGETAESLQDRYCKSIPDDCNRGRWSQSPNAREASSGQEKRHFFDWIGVESVEVYQQRSIEQSGDVSSEDFVYNLEVEDWHTYLVDGDRGSYVVHNCHHATADSYRKILDGYPESYVLGVTATPCRTDGSGFDDLFDALVSVIGVKDLIAQGSLCKYKLFADPNPIKTKGIKTTAGDYNQKELAQSVNSSVLSANLVQTYRDRCPNKRCVVFAINVEHSMAIADRYKQAGIPAEHLDGETPSGDRKAILERFKTGETLVVSNVGILTEGFNLPSIEAVQIARPTKSLSLWLQIVGRALRPAPNKEFALILDHTENWMKLGMPCAKHIWTLEGVEPEEKKPKFRKTKDNEIVEDGFFEIEEGDAELAEIGEDDVKAIAIQLEIEQFNKLLEIAEHRQYKKAWAVYKFLEIEPSYEALLVCAGIMGYKPQWAAVKYKEYA